MAYAFHAIVFVKCEPTILPYFTVNSNERALIGVIKRAQKSILVLLVVGAVMTLVLSSFAIQNAVKQQAARAAYILDSPGVAISYCTVRVLLDEDVPDYIEPISEFDINLLNSSTIVQSFAFGLLIIILSTAVPAVFMMRKNPKMIMLRNS